MRHDTARLLAQVFDGNPSLPVLAVPLPRIGGRGLVLVERLSDNWGFTSSETGKCVWVEFVDHRDDRPDKTPEDSIDAHEI